MSSGEFEERVITVPLRDALAGSRTDRADRAMKLVRAHLAKQFSVSEDVVRLDPSINETIWGQGRENPPSKLRVRAARFDEEGEPVVEAETTD